MNIGIFVMGFFFGVVETAHFGWNFTPQSDAEMICDGITILIMALSLVGKQSQMGKQAEPGK